LTISDSRCTAHHEAAHVVIYLLFGIEVEQVTLYPDEAGLCSFSDDPPPSYGRLLAILAGAEADKRLLEDKPDLLSKRKSGWNEDDKRATEVFRDLGRTGSIEEVREESAKLVHENWQIIRSLAELWIEVSESNFRDGDPQYFMMGNEVKEHVERFRTKAKDVPN
jgi:hypothetical protein